MTREETSIYYDHSSDSESSINLNSEKNYQTLENQENQENQENYNINYQIYIMILGIIFFPLSIPLCIIGIYFYIYSNNNSVKLLAAINVLIGSTLIIMTILFGILIIYNFNI